jgi:hypothetical protein
MFANSSRAEEETAGNTRSPSREAPRETVKKVQINNHRNMVIVDVDTDGEKMQRRPTETRTRLLLRYATLLPSNKMVRPGFEPGTFCVLDRCDNQLRHRTLSKRYPNSIPLLALIIVSKSNPLLDYCISLYHGHLWPVGMSFLLEHRSKPLIMNR